MVQGTATDLLLMPSDESQRVCERELVRRFRDDAWLSFIYLSISMRESSGAECPGPLIFKDTSV